MFTKLIGAIVGVTILAFGGICEAKPHKGSGAKPNFQTVCASDSWYPDNNVLYVETDCPSGAVALGGGPTNDPGQEFDTTLSGSSGPLLDSNNQMVGWTYTSIRSDSGLNDGQFQSIVVTVCVECAE
jgi:hypothetical protein